MNPYNTGTPIAVGNGVIESFLPDLAAEFAHDRLHADADFSDHLTVVCQCYVTTSPELAEVFMKAYEMGDDERTKMIAELAGTPNNEGMTRFFTLVICRPFGGSDKITEKPKKSYIH